jgi:(5-formylfuran-3-yl)methyl phosphate synthase
VQLLVSVRSASEVEPALTGGADIIDAKEPAGGSLGPVSAATLAEILLRVPSNRAFSVALGDVNKIDEVVTALASLQLPRRPAPVFVKLGFAGVRSSAVVSTLIATAVRMAARQASSPLIVAVAYADAHRAGTLSAEMVCQLAKSAGAAGVLLDTHFKDGTGLLDWFDAAALNNWVSDARRAGLLTALAGALALEDLDTVAGAAPEIIGVRGAACDGGREGRVSAERVGCLRRRLDVGAQRVFPDSLAYAGRGTWRNA